ncbi:hypothetical protein LCGC14_2783010, partial [marine sediment metagenome]
MNPKLFAADYDRDEQGRILFPRDSQMRSHFFPYTEAREHVAKCNMLMIQALVEYVSEPGEIILDPFAGSGTLLIAATMGREVILMELEEYYCGTIELNLVGIRQTVPNVDDLVTVIPGNSFNLLPLEDFCHHMIFSPPYPMGLKKKGSMDKTSQDMGYSSAVEYSSDPENFTNLNSFMYHQKIERFYKKCYQTQKPGGTMTIIINRAINLGIELKSTKLSISTSTFKNQFHSQKSLCSTSTG